MKTKILLLLIFTSFYSANAQKYFIQLLNADEKPVDLSGSTYKIEILKPSGGKFSEEDQRSDGLYTFDASPGGFFQISDAETGAISMKQLLSGIQGSPGSPIKYYFTTSIVRTLTNTGVAASSNNYWVGAKVSHNLNGGGSDDIVGGTKIKINPSTFFKEDSKNSLSIIGNIGTFVSNSNKDDVQSAISKLVQSQTGLGLGIGYIREFVSKESKAKVKTRAEFTTGYRLNSFKDPNDEKSSIGLNQLRSSLLFEAETMEWKNGGAMSLSVEGSHTTFSKTTYQKIFDEKKSGKVAAEITLIIPLSNNVGFLANVVMSKGIKPIYQFGISIKTNE